MVFPTGDAFSVVVVVVVVVIVVSYIGWGFSKVVKHLGQNHNRTLR